MLTHIQELCMTDKTRKSLGYPTLSRPDLSIHYNTDKRTRSNECSKPPVTREGKPYPGGRSLRRSLRRLNTRRQMHQGKSQGHTLPGSMS